jgi:hypothetical protein
MWADHVVFTICKLDRDDRNVLKDLGEPIKMSLRMWINRSPDQNGLKDLGKMIKLSSRNGIEKFGWILKARRSNPFYRTDWRQITFQPGKSKIPFQESRPTFWGRRLKWSSDMRSNTFSVPLEYNVLNNYLCQYSRLWSSEHWTIKIFQW